MKSSVILDFEVEGYHKYPSAPKQVEFLKYPHRHLFQIKAYYKVTDLDREKEIFIQTNYLKEYLNESYGSPCQFGAMSCEMIALDLLQFIREDGGYKVDVLEDGKGGACVEL
jgi:hypothetical protein